MSGFSGQNGDASTRLVSAAQTPKVYPWIGVALVLCFFTLVFTSNTAFAAHPDESATPMVKSVKHFLRMKNADAPGPVSVSILDKPGSTNACRDPQPAVAGAGYRTTGRLIIVVKCPHDPPTRRYFQAQVSITADYWVASKTLPAGQKMKAGMIKQTHGSITDLPGTPVLKRTAIVGQVTRRRIPDGTPINKNMIAPPKVIKRGDRVEIILKGPGFTIRTFGKALRSASAGATVKVRTGERGNITGTAQKNGKVLILQ